MKIKLPLKEGYHFKTYASWLQKSQLNYLLSRHWINHCYNRLHHRHALQALHDPQGDLHGGGTSFSEIQVDLQKSPRIIRLVSNNVTNQRTDVGATNALAS